MFFASVKNLNASHPPSLPTPDAFTPPKGVLRSLTNQAFIQTIPISNWSATRCAFFKFVVQTEDAKPYLVEFAAARTSSSVSKTEIVTTGPKISS